MENSRSAINLILAAGFRALIYIAAAIALPALSPHPASAESQVWGAGLYGSNGSCGSGAMIAPDLVVTNAHVARTICPSGRCNDVRIRVLPLKADGSGTTLLFSELATVRRLAFPDLALLSIHGCRNCPHSAAATYREPAGAEQVKMIGAPRCAPPRTDAGLLRSSDGELQSDLQADFGNSGSGIWGADGALLGIVDEVANPLRAVRSWITGARFTPRIIPILSNKALLTGDLSESLLGQARLLVQYQQRALRASSTLERARLASEIISAVEDLRLQIAQSASPPPELEPLGTPNRPLNELNFSEADRALIGAQLVVAASLEQFGVYDGSQRRLAISALPKELQQAAEAFDSGGFMGMTRFTLAAAAAAAAGIVLLAVIWGASVGAAFALFGRLRDPLIVGFCAWPLSLLWLWILARRRRRLADAPVKSS